jgi:hypothetical protein
MSKAEILEELPKLTPAEQDEIRHRLDELDDDTLSPEEWALIDKRIAEHEAHPESAITWRNSKHGLSRNLVGELSPRSPAAGLRRHRCWHRMV